ncbi:YaiI/YqxD family protein [Psychrobacter celer]|uniref:YaiI/YqxD family protein n=1 Tax=Psychrobacter celer TaxID=306572 RepID=UPI0018DFAC7F|nr:YaiI/YqxD family protein [Psychrobacter celer]
MQIWVDADSVPSIAKDLIIKTAERTQTAAIFVANQPIKLRRSPLLTMTVVPSGFDKADDYIVEQIQAGDLAITSDIPLANDILDKGALVLTTRGIIYNKENIKQKLNMRDFMDTMRGTGVLEPQEMSVQKPYGERDKKAFADGLNKLVR